MPATQAEARRHDADPGQRLGPGLKERRLGRAAGRLHQVAARRRLAQHFAQQLGGEAKVVGGLDALLDARFDLAHAAQRAGEHQHQQRQQDQGDQHLDQGEAAAAAERGVHRITSPGCGRRSGRRLLSSKLRSAVPSCQRTSIRSSCRRAACGAALPAGVG